jgi:hypothetical protein
MPAETPQHRYRDSSGFVDDLILMPVFLLLIFLGVQGAMWYLAKACAQAGAQAGAQALAAGASCAQVSNVAERAIAFDVRSPQLTIQPGPNGQQEVMLTGIAPSIIPLTTVHVTGTAFIGVSNLSVVASCT